MTSYPDYIIPSKTPSPPLSSPQKAAPVDFSSVGTMEEFNRFMLCSLDKEAGEEGGVEEAGMGNDADDASSVLSTLWGDLVGPMTTALTKKKEKKKKTKKKKSAKNDNFETKEKRCSRKEEEGGGMGGGIGSKPRKALTPYNLFFRYERARLLMTMDATEAAAASRAAHEDDVADHDLDRGLEYTKRSSHDTVVTATAAATSNNEESAIRPLISRSSEQQHPDDTFPTADVYAHASANRLERLNLVRAFLSSNPYRVDNRTRLHRRSHGKISLREMVAVISKSWMAADDDVKSIFRELSDEDRVRHAKEVRTFHSRNALLIGGGSGDADGEKTGEKDEESGGRGVGREVVGGGGGGGSSAGKGRKGRVTPPSHMEEDEEEEEEEGEWRQWKRQRQLYMRGDKNEDKYNDINFAVRNPARAHHHKLFDTTPPATTSTSTLTTTTTTTTTTMQAMRIDESQLWQELHIRHWKQLLLPSLRCESDTTPLPSGYQDESSILGLDSAAAPPSPSPPHSSSSAHIAAPAVAPAADFSGQAPIATVYVPPPTNSTEDIPFTIASEAARAAARAGVEAAEAEIAEWGEAAKVESGTAGTSISFASSTAMLPVAADLVNVLVGAW